MTQPVPGPVVAGTGGGVAAKRAALATVAALAIVVLVAVAGRGPAPPPAPNQEAIAVPVASREAPVATPVQAAPSATPRPTAGAAATGVYIIAGLIGGSTFRAELVESASDSGTYEARYTVPDPVVRGGTLAFEITPSPTGVRSRGDTLGVFLLDLEALAANHRTGREGHRAVVAGRPTVVDAPLPVRAGFVLSVSVALAFNHVAVVEFELQVDPLLRASLEGNDGVIGCLPLKTCRAQD